MVLSSLARTAPRLARPSAAAVRRLGAHPPKPIDAAKFPGAADFMGDIAHFEAQPAFRGKGWKAKGLVWFVIVGGCALPIYQLIKNPCVAAGILLYCCCWCWLRFVIMRGCSAGIFFFFLFLFFFSFFFLFSFFSLSLMPQRF
jgi:hypothetical protein